MSSHQELVQLIIMLTEEEIRKRKVNSQRVKECVANKKANPNNSLRSVIFLRQQANDENWDGEVGKQHWKSDK